MFKKDTQIDKSKLFFLMISNGEKWYLLAVKKLLTLLRGMTSKNNDDFYRLNCLHSFRTNSNLECIIEKTDVCKNNLENSSTTKESGHFP